MNINKIFSQSNTLNDSSIKNHKLNSLLINQLFVYAIEDNEEKFDNILNKVFLNDTFSIVVNYNADFDNDSVTINEEDDFHSPLHAACNLLSDKYCLKIIKQLIHNHPNSIDTFFNHNEKISLINLCISRNLESSLNSLLDNKLINNEHINQSIYLFNINLLSEKNPNVLIDNFNEAIETYDNFINHFLNLERKEKNSLVSNLIGNKSLPNILNNFQTNILPALLFFNNLKLFNKTQTDVFKNSIIQLAGNLSLDVNTKLYEEPIYNEKLQETYKKYSLNGDNEDTSFFSKVKVITILDHFNLKSFDLEKIAEAQKNYISSKYVTPTNNNNKKSKI